MVDNKILKNLNIKIFADGANLDSIIKLNNLDFISGFTTNPTLMKKAGVADYKKFANDLVSIIPSKPISFEVFADDLFEMEEQALEIASWGENINVKIPITNTKGELTDKIINNLSKRKIKLNITAIFTMDQIKAIKDSIEDDVYTIISVFAGRIADTGVDPSEMIKNTLQEFKMKPMSKILWASPRELLNIFQAERVGCHIITVADDILKKINLINKDLKTFSLETVKMFYNDAVSAGYKI